jgi:hypothetical protein
MLSEAFILAKEKIGDAVVTMARGIQESLGNMRRAFADNATRSSGSVTPFRLAI